MQTGHPHISSPVVVFDLEFTAWDGSMAERWLKPGQYREVVQIGAVRLDARTLAEEASLDVLVRPRFNPVLSPYFEGLTGITNAMLAERGLDFAAARARFAAFCGNAETFAFGRDDLIFEENVRLYGMAPPPKPLRYTNLVPWLNANGAFPRHAGDVAEVAGAAFAGQKHDALYDARSVARGVAALVSRGAKNPFVRGA